MEGSRSLRSCLTCSRPKGGHVSRMLPPHKLPDVFYFDSPDAGHSLIPISVFKALLMSTRTDATSPLELADDDLPLDGFVIPNPNKYQTAA